MAEFEFAGMTFRGGKMMVILTALSTLGAGAWGAFEVYKDYMDMKEIVKNINVDAIESRNKVIETKLDEAIEYTRDIKSGLRDDILRIEKQVDRVEDTVKETEAKVFSAIKSAEERFENKRDALQNDYDSKSTSLRESNQTRMDDLNARINRELKELEDRLKKRLQRALDNPLAN